MPRPGHEAEEFQFSLNQINLSKEKINEKIGNLSKILVKSSLGGMGLEGVTG